MRRLSQQIQVRGPPPWSVIDGTWVRVADAFAEILRFHVPPPATILDPCCGQKIIYQKLLNKTLDGKDYKFVFGDIKKELGSIRLDCRKLPFRDEIFDAVVFDPPYLIDDGRRLGDPRRDAYGIPNTTQEQIHEFFLYANTEFHRVLKPCGVLIVKCRDHYLHSTHTFLAHHKKSSTFLATSLYMILYFTKRSFMKTHWCERAINTETQVSLFTVTT